MGVKIFCRLNYLVLILGCNKNEAEHCFLCSLCQTVDFCALQRRQSVVGGLHELQIRGVTIHINSSA